MLIRFSREGKFLLIVALCVFSSAITGCAESNFNLASESRLPNWFTPPPGLTRPDVSVTLDYYSLPLVPDAIFTLKDKNGKQLSKVKGKVRDSSPLYLKSCPDRRLDSDCPSYEVITAKGITEIIRNRPYREHENMEQNGEIVALFYVIDDPAVKKELLESDTYVKTK